MCELVLLPTISRDVISKTRYSHFLHLVQEFSLLVVKRDMATGSPSTAERVSADGTVSSRLLRMPQIRYGTSIILRPVLRGTHYAEVPGGKVVRGALSVGLAVEVVGLVGRWLRVTL